MTNFNSREVARKIVEKVISVNHGDAGFGIATLAVEQILKDALLAALESAKREERERAEKICDDLYNELMEQAEKEEDPEETKRVICEMENCECTSMADQWNIGQLSRGEGGPPMTALDKVRKIREQQPKYGKRGGCIGFDFVLPESEAAALLTDEPIPPEEIESAESWLDDSLVMPSVETVKALCLRLIADNRRLRKADEPSKTAEELAEYILRQYSGIVDWDGEIGRTVKIVAPLIQSALDAKAKECADRLCRLCGDCGENPGKSRCRDRAAILGKEGE